MNTFEVTGRLVRDIEDRVDRSGHVVKTKQGKTVAGSSVADQHSRKAGDVSYFQFVLYGETADTAKQQFGKGDLVHIKGWWKQNRWKGVDGKTKSNLELRVQEIYPVFPKTAGDPSDSIPAWADDGNALEE